MDDYKNPDERLVEAIQKISEGMITMRNALIPVISELVEIAKQITMMYYLTFSNNAKVKHLALHSRKARVRKKNIHRLQREVMK